MDEHTGVGNSRREAVHVVTTAEALGAGERDERLSSPRAWQIMAALIGALLLAIVIAGVVTLIENNRVKEITERALSFDIEVEDEASDVQVAVLELRHIHRNIVYSGSTVSTIADFDDAYAALQEELGELESLGLDQMGITQPARIRALAERYYADFRPVLDQAADEPLAFQAANEIGLTRLEDMGDAANQIDNLGDILADNSLARIRAALRTEQLLLSGLVVGALLVGIVLALASARLLARLRSLYEREQQGRRDLARALQTKTDFIADASHELRTPLAIILGNAETALAGNDRRHYATALSAIAEESDRMRKIVDDLLFLARSDAGSPPLEKEFVPARWLVSRLVKPGEMLAQQRSSCLTAQVGGEGYLDADPQRIEQAVLALIDNAARHSPPSVCVELTSRTDGSDFVIEVADHGSGISPDELPLIFDRFYQVKNRRARKRGASGLGLSIARSIIVAHDGSISAESQIGEGTRMSIRLPLSPLPEAVDEPPLPAAQTTTRSAR